MTKNFTLPKGATLDNEDGSPSFALPHGAVLDGDEQREMPDADAFKLPEGAVLDEEPEPRAPLSPAEEKRQKVKQILDLKRRTLDFSDEPLKIEFSPLQPVREMWKTDSKRFLESAKLLADRQKNQERLTRLQSELTPEEYQTYLADVQAQDWDKNKNGYAILSDGEFRFSPQALSNDDDFNKVLSAAMRNGDLNEEQATAALIKLGELQSGNKARQLELAKTTSNFQDYLKKPKNKKLSEEEVFDRYMQDGGILAWTKANLKATVSGGWEFLASQALGAGFKFSEMLGGDTEKSASAWLRFLNESMSKGVASGDVRYEGTAGSTLGQVGAQVLSKVIEGAVMRKAGASKLTAATLSNLTVGYGAGLQIGAEEYQKVYDANVETHGEERAHEMAMKALNDNIPVGFTEIIPIDRILSKLPRGKVMGALKMLSDSALEVAQEDAQSSLSNAIRGNASGEYIEPDGMTWTQRIEMGGGTLPVSAVAGLLGLRSRNEIKSQLKSAGLKANEEDVDRVIKAREDSAKARANNLPASADAIIDVENKRLEQKFETPDFMELFKANLEERNQSEETLDAKLNEEALDPVKSAQDKTTGLLSNIGAEVRKDTNGITSESGLATHYEFDENGNPKIYIAVDEDKLHEQRKGFNTGKEYADYVSRAFNEELIHAADFEASRRQWEKSDTDSGFATFHKQRREQLWHGLDEQDRQALTGIYGEDLGAEGNAAELIRMVTQLERGGKGKLRITELTHRSLSAIRDYLKEVFGVFNDLIKRNKSPELRQAYEQTKAVLDEIEAEFSKREENSKPLEHAESSGELAAVAGQGLEAAAPRRGISLKEVGEDFPRDDASPRLMNTTGDVFARAKQVFMGWSEHMRAADGSQILMHNPDRGLLDARVRHMIYDNKTRSVDGQKAAWLPMVPETLQNAAVRVLDADSGNRIYVREYADGQKHMVVVTPNGTVYEQSPFTGKLVTQFAKQNLGKRGEMLIEWVRPTRSEMPPHSVSPTISARAAMETESGADEQKNNDTTRRPSQGLQAAAPTRQSEEVGRRWLEVAKRKDARIYDEFKDHPLDDYEEYHNIDSKSLKTLLSDVDKKTADNIRIVRQYVDKNDNLDPNGKETEREVVRLYDKREPLSYIQINNPDSGRVSINSYSSNTEASTPIYQAIYAWAHNNGKVVVPDETTTKIGLFRRNSQMLNSALRLGTTSHMEPNPENGLDWREGDHAHNIGEMARKEAEYVSNQFNGLFDGWRYDSARDRFHDSQGTEIQPEQVRDRIIQTIKAYNEQNSDSSIRAGEATVRRALATRDFQQTTSSDFLATPTEASRPAGLSKALYAAAPKRDNEGEYGKGNILRDLYGGLGNVTNPDYQGGKYQPDEKIVPPIEMRESNRSAIKEMARMAKQLAHEASHLKKHSDLEIIVQRMAGDHQVIAAEAVGLARDVIKKVEDIKAREGINHWIEAGGDETVLREQLAAIPEKGHELRRRGYEAALKLTPEQLAVARQIKDIFALLAQREKMWGFNINEIENYVTHLWERPGILGGAGGGRKLNGNLKYAKPRIYDTYFEGEQAGLQGLRMKAE